jgi:hypothetical protein
MKVQFFEIEAALVLMLVSTASFADKPPKPGMKLVNTRYFSGEVVPGYDVNVTFDVPNCPVSSTLPTVKEYESEAMMNSVDTGEAVPVRIVHLYAFDSNTPTNGCPISGLDKSVEITHKIAHDKKRMTHYFITMGEHVKISDVENKKASDK